MKKSILLLCLFVTGFMIVGYGPKSYSDLAPYKRIPTKTRIESLLKAGNDLFLRRLYNEANSIFKMVLDLDKNNLDAKMMMTKINNVYERERNEENKKALYQKWGHLTPIDKIYTNWHWGPEVGHFEVRYSEPKPYIPAVRKFRPRATDEEINEALNAYKKSKTADNAFELAMRYWSQRKEPEAIKYYFEAADLSSDILERDDNYMLSMITEELEEKINKGSNNPQDYYNHGRLALIQGNTKDGIRNLIKAVKMDKKLISYAKNYIDKYITEDFKEIMGIPAEIYSFRQAYVFNKNKDMVYLRLIICPMNKRQLIPIDTTIPASFTGDISIESKDVLYVYKKKGIGDSIRLWLALPEKEGNYPEYHVKLIINLKRGTEYDEDGGGVELSNFGLSSEQLDNWSFVISSEFDNTDPTLPGDYEKVENGVRIHGYQLWATDGKGPYISFRDFSESLPSDANIWKIIENKEDDMKPIF